MAFFLSLSLSLTPPFSKGFDDDDDGDDDGDGDGDEDVESADAPAHARALDGMLERALAHMGVVVVEEEDEDEEEAAEESSAPQLGLTNKARAKLGGAKKKFPPSVEAQKLALGIESDPGGDGRDRLSGTIW